MLFGNPLVMAIETRAHKRAFSGIGTRLPIPGAISEVYGILNVGGATIVERGVA